MFTRRDPQPTKPGSETHEEPPTQVAPAPTPPAPAPAPVAPPASASTAPQSGPETSAMSTIAAGDTFEGTLTTTNGVRVLGTVRGTIESKSNVQVDQDALVEADIQAENVTIAGTYKGKLNCNERLEITETGRASGELETGRILLHEGGFFEGTLHMKPQPPAPVQAETPRRRYGGS